MNEADFTAFLQETFPFSHGRGIGDDASVVKCGDVHQLISKDILIENIHFKLEHFTLEELALKALAVNLSDIAAMGGEPQYFYVGLGFPQRMKKETCLDFFKGLKKGCQQWRVELAGGDFSISPVMSISITVVGKAQKPIYRHDAQTHDLVGITGPTGESALGLKLLLQGIKNGYFVDKHKQVTSEIQKGQILSRYVHAMIDLSDGLLIDLNRVLTASKKGARLYYQKLPVSQNLKKVCRENGWDQYETVLAGGEDYVLLFTISRENQLKLRKENQNLGYYIIGEVTGIPGVLTVEHRGKEIQTTYLGYDHFQQK
ncbi:MAG: thiamine-phosphate kinase [Candidatus Aminicenantes bacterium]|nr:MAG: thiamine-phosphate kinase [Candidatus Aminicenantes bacterium]